MEGNHQMKSRWNQEQQQQEEEEEKRAFCKEMCKKWNPTEISKGFVLFFLFAFALLIIFKGPAAGFSDYGLFSRFLSLQPPTPPTTTTTPNPINYRAATGVTNITEENSYVAQDSIKNNITAKKNHTYDKFLGGLIAEGFEDGSCLSRYRWNLFRKTPPANGRHQPSSYLVSKLRKYEALHKICGPNTTPFNAAVEFMNRKKKRHGGGKDDYPSCKYIIWNPSPGLGNRMLSLASAFLYALVTDRVLLLRQERGGDMCDIFCEPFPETSWLIPRNFPYGGYKIFDTNFRYRFGVMMKAHSLGKVVPPIMYVNLNNHYEDNDYEKRFFCDEEQTHMQKVTFMMISSNQYFGPALFLVPSFQQELENLFPEKQTVFHHLGRYLFHPTNPVWGLITRYYEGYLARADERIGIQIRVFNERGQKGPLKNVLEEIVGCATAENLLPKLGGGDEVKSEESSRNLAVLVTSLRPGYYEELRSMYLYNATVSGEAVAFYQPSHEELQRVGNSSHDVKALAEIYLLSLTDKIMVTDWSTFGYVAYSLGGLQPWIMHPPRDGRFCDHSSSMEPCLHYPPPNLVCGNNNASTTVAYAGHCEDATQGLKLFDNLIKS